MNIPKIWKNRIKSALKQLRNWRDKHFFSFDSDDLEKALTRLGIRQGDTVLVHSSYDAFLGYSGKPSDVLDILKQLVGPEGIIMMPTMGFTGTAVDYAMTNPVMDNKRIPSRMGLITELLRRSPGVIRSLHPTHPIAVWGNDAKAMAAGHHLAKTPCGNPSPLHKLLDRNGKILLLGADFEVLTFYHTIEEILEDRLPVKPFTDQTFDLAVKDDSGTLWPCRTRLYDPKVSRRRSLKPLLAELKRMNAWFECRVKRLPVNLIHAGDVLKATENLLSRGVHCYE